MEPCPSSAHSRLAYINLPAREAAQVTTFIEPNPSFSEPPTPFYCITFHNSTSHIVSTQTTRCVINCSPNGSTFIQEQCINTLPNSTHLQLLRPTLQMLSPYAHSSKNPQSPPGLLCSALLYSTLSCCTRILVAASGSCSCHSSSRTASSSLSRAVGCCSHCSVPSHTDCTGTLPLHSLHHSGPPCTHSARSSRSAPRREPSHS